METAARTPADAHHREPAPVEPLVAGPTIDTSNTTATGQGQSSAGYLQTARETLASIAGTVQNAVGIETPASTLHSIADNTRIDASMPSSETSGTKPGERVGGVGTLPGDNNEEGVARLPAERTSVPSREHEGAYPGEKSGGVGALPGHLNESSVAVLPEERAVHTKEGTESSTRAAVLPATTGHPTTPEHLTTAPTTAHSTAHSTAAHSTTAPLAAAHPTSTHPTTEHSTSEHLDKGDIKAAAAHPIETAKARRDSTSSSSSSEGEQDLNDPNAPKRKATLKNKVAGGMKKAMGKLKKDEDMIAEGQAQRGH
ncbi:unnamed protein product [Rhizoctonia solani]|uniref:Uncharacterized protein n=3 Tax=Rhizoctonia solani TaxID=456999 RepID=A0A8H3HMB5_9AGAM|nr:CsbD domain protein [Rhizoctonia solani AG-3 Rhs1AP]KEP52286.1 CsbD domain protein [Rhizoctonia solani 123E]CAE6525352.1 unnamed protein product [Rhizoctonia solani]CAE6532999.1 unnamed protein product [Rhizoctonia solani]